MHKIKNCCITCILVISCCNVFTQPQGYLTVYNIINNNNGLSSREVYCTVEDNNGFMWFGTRNGLNRYTGNSVNVFTSRNSALRDNKIAKLVIDDADNLFVMYASNGYKLSTTGKVDVMHLKTGAIQTLTDAYPDMPFKEEDILWMHNNRQGEILFYTYAPLGFWKYSSKAGFKLIEPLPPPQESITVYRNNIWGNIFNNDKAVVLANRPDRSRMLYYFNGTQAIPAKVDTGVSFKKLYYAISLQHIKGFGIKGSDKIIQQLAAQKAVAFTPSQNDSSCIIYSPSGIKILYNNTVLTIIDSSNSAGLSNLYVYNSFKDSRGQLWLCTSLGVIQISIHKNYFTTYFTKQQQHLQLNNQVRGIGAYNNNVYANVWNNLFINTPDGDIALLMPGIGHPLLKQGNNIYTAQQGSINITSLINNTRKTIQLPQNTENIWCIYPAADTFLLLGSFNKIAAYHLTTNKITADSTKLNTGFIYKITELKSLGLTAIAENGLYAITMQGHVIKQHNQLNKKIQSLSLLDAAEDKYGNIWLATNGDGLYKWNVQSNSLMHYNMASGLPSDVLYRIEQDDNNNLWISTDNGLLMFNTLTGYTYAYTVKDGISHDEFNRISSFKDENGRLYFGGLNGITAFYPNQLIRQKDKNNIPFTIIKYSQYVSADEKIVDKTYALIDAKRIDLYAGDKFFDIEYAQLDYDSRPTQYAYKIDGFDSSWVYTQSKSIRISGLSYGTYTLHIKAQTQNGRWNSNAIVLPLTMHKPFYVTRLFLLLLAVSLIALVALIIKLRIRRLAKQKQHLQHLVNTRTLQLNESLSQKELLLKEIHHRVKNNLEVISSLLELQSAAITDEATKAVLAEGQSRLQSIAIVHHAFYNNDDIGEIELQAFITQLYNQVAAVFTRPGTQVSFTIMGDEYAVDMDAAVPLGLIINELLTNTFKYAIKAGFTNTINIKISKGLNQLNTITYSDSGPGLANTDALKSRTSLGMRIIHLLARQLGGSINYYYNDGAVFEISFK